MTATTNSAPLRAGAISAARDYQELPAWQKSIALAEATYKACEGFPVEALANEIRLAATRIATHIAAAAGKPSEQGMLNSYYDAQAANAEFSTLVTIADNLSYLRNAKDLQASAEEISRLLAGMRHGMKVEAKDTKRAQAEVAERDRAHAERAERFERKPKRDYGERAPRERSDRDTGREERQYKPRGEYKSRGDKPYGERKPRGEGEYKPRAPRGEGEYKPRGERTPYGDKKPYGDKPRGERKPYGDKKPYGDRPRHPYKD